MHAKPFLHVLVNRLLCFDFIGFVYGRCCGCLHFCVWNIFQWRSLVAFVLWVVRLLQDIDDCTILILRWCDWKLASEVIRVLPSSSIYT